MSQQQERPASHEGSEPAERHGYHIYAEPGGSRGAAELFSSLVATTSAMKGGCDVHEHCNGFCGAASKTETTTKYQPNHSLPGRPVVTFRSETNTMGTQGIEQRPPHDAKWLVAEQLLDFWYDDIDSTAGVIRLLKVKEAIYRVDVLECELHEFELSAAPAFEGLSYFWGPARFDHPIICNGKILYIAESLHTALKRFRQCPSDDRLDYVWADAICINQSDKSELTRQVLLMRSIYTTAQAVRVDLGNCSSDWFEGLNLLHTLQYAYESGVITLSRDSGTSTACNHYAIPDLNHVAWDRFMEVFASPWFTRTWIIQEVALAKERKIFYGRFSFTWDMLITSLEVTETLFPQILSSRGNRSTTGYLNSVKIRNLIAWNSRPRSFFASLYPLIIAKDFDATDPRDKIIGLLGLIDEKPHTYKDGVLPAFEPDYTIGLKAFYHRHTIHLFDLLLGHGALNFAGLHRRTSLPITAPSWVIDWNAQSRTFLTSHFASIRPVGFIAGGKDGFNVQLASKGPGVEPDLLMTTGTCFDRITTLSSVLDFRAAKQPDEVYNQLALEWFEEVSALILSLEGGSESSLSPATFAYGAKWKDALALTLLCGDTYTGENAVRASEPILHPAATLDAVIEYLEKVTQENASDTLRAYPSSSTMAAEDRRVSTFITQMHTACRQRRFAISERGRFALVPEITEIGDELFVIVGGPLAFVLGSSMANGRLGRASRPGEPLIGDAYVQGWMEGETVGTEDFEHLKRNVCIG